MSTDFLLPDLGEGLPDAIIREWYIAEGDQVKLDQPMVAMETAKALVDVPAPYSGVIKKLHGKVGDTIQTGSPLVTITSQEKSTTKPKSTTVVGSMHDEARIAPQTQRHHAEDITTKLTAEAWSLLQQYDLDEDQVNNYFANHTLISADDIKSTITKNKISANNHSFKRSLTTINNAKPFTGVRAAMAEAMEQSHQKIAAVTIMEDANIDCWDKQQDFTVRIIQAVCDAVKMVPIINSHYDAQQKALLTIDDINIGIAMDTQHGLFVPVIYQAQGKQPANLRREINTLKENAKAHTFKPEQLKNPSISISNFGTLGAQYATPMVVPPMVAIIGIGQAKNQVISDKQKNIIIANMLPLSLTVDHCAITGGEATRFLAAMISSLEKKTCQ